MSAPMKPLQQDPRAPSGAGCDGHPMVVLLTPDLPQKAWGIAVLLTVLLSAPYSAGSHFSQQSKSFALPSLIRCSTGL